VIVIMIAMEIMTGTIVTIAIAFRKAPSERPAATFASMVIDSTPGAAGETTVIGGALHSSISTAAVEKSQT